MKPHTTNPLLIIGISRYSPFRHFLVTAAALLLLTSPRSDAITPATLAEWQANPVNGNWNNAANWSPAVPNGPSDTAIFETSSITSVSLTANTQVAAIRFDSGASAFTITASPTFTLTISGNGITNNSAFIDQTFVAGVNGSSQFGTIVFSNSATAGTVKIDNQASTVTGASSGSTHFGNTSNAGNANIVNRGGQVASQFGGETDFGDSSSASNAIVVNNGGVVTSANGGKTNFSNNSTAGSATIVNAGTNGINAAGGLTNFFNTSTAANATINNTGGTTEFHDTSTAGGATIHNGDSGVAVGGLTEFHDNSTAGTATITNIGLSNSQNGTTNFFDNSNAGSASITNNGSASAGTSEGLTVFTGTSSASSATITNNGATVNNASGGETGFNSASTAGNATLIANGGSNGGRGGRIVFSDDSTGATSRIEIFGSGDLDIGFHSGPGVTVGSIEGDGNVFLGSNQLTVGANNRSTTFAGQLQDGGPFNTNTGGSLTKIGTGTLNLSGTNTYTGATNVNAGVLQVDGSITSNTFVNSGGTLAGAGIVNGSVANNGGTVSPGDAPGTLTVNSFTQMNDGTLLIQIAGASSGQFSLLNVLGTAGLDGALDPVLLNGFIPTVGEQFVFLDYASHSGIFSNIENQTFDNGMEQWEVIYENTDAYLTVESASGESVPDRGSTILLLVVGLLTLASYHRYNFSMKQSLKFQVPSFGSASSLNGFSFSP